MTTPALGRPALDRETCAALDAADPLASFRSRFSLPRGVVYLDGNSLGALPNDTAAHVQRVITEEWGTGLIRSWNDAGWFTKPQTVGDLVAPLIGADPGQVVLGDSTSSSIFQAAVAAARLRPGRRAIVAESGSFPTDLYVLESVQELLGAGVPLERRLISDDGPTLDDVLGEDVAVVVLTHVDYRTGRMHDMADVTRRIHAVGAVVVWDLCHSVGAVPVDLIGADADFAVGCTYKYLNGGPGSPSFIWASEKHLRDARPALTGWHGHAKPFDFTVDYAPAPGIERFRVGTPQLLSMSALEVSLRLWAEVDVDAVREKSLCLTELFISLVDARLTPRWGVEVVTPRESARRGSQVSLRVSHGYEIMQALIERGVIGDFRAPDLIRFGFTPLYTSYTDVWDAVDVLEGVLDSGVWREPRFARRGTVT